MVTPNKTESFDGQSTAPLKEPEYDVKRLKHDVLYRNVLAGDFTKHMKTLTDSSLRVDYFRRMAKAMNMFLIVNPNYLLAQQCAEPYNHEILLDDEGNGLIRSQWLCMFIQPTTERSLFNKAYFFDKYPDFTDEIEGIPVRSFDEWKLNFQKESRSQDYVRLQLEDVNDRIQTAQQGVSTLISENYFTHMSQPKVLEIGKTAATLIERELGGIKAIDWDVFANEKQLMVLATLWDLVTFKVFKKNLISYQNIITTETTSTRPRGQYNTKKTEYINYYFSEAQSDVYNFLKQKEKPNWKKIEQKIFEKMKINKQIPDRTLRSYFPAHKSTVRFSEICRRFFEQNGLTNNELT